MTVHLRDFWKLGSLKKREILLKDQNSVNLFKILGILLAFYLLHCSAWTLLLRLVDTFRICWSFWKPARYLQLLCKRLWKLFKFLLLFNAIKIVVGSSAAGKKKHCIHFWFINIYFSQATNDNSFFTTLKEISSQITNSHEFVDVVDVGGEPGLKLLLSGH